MTEKLESTLVGVAGEYLVAGELTLRGYLASITLRNSRGIDIVASNRDATKSVTIQVKTNSDGSSVWMLNKKAEDFWSEHHFYIFVSLKELGERPAFYIAPSKVVADFTTKFHRRWLSGKKRDGTKRLDSNMRKFADKEGKYLEAWYLLTV